MAAPTLPHGRKYNFGAGPSTLPLECLEKAQKEMLNWNNTGLSVMEMSHRTADFGGILNKAIDDLKEIMNVPANYKILFMIGGGTGQFAAVAMNLMGLKPGHCADYMVNGTWSIKAAKEAEKYGKVNLVFPATKKYTGVPDKSEWKLDSSASYLYYCDNETINGIEFTECPQSDPSVPVVCDMSSNMLSKTLDISKYGLIFFGAQKNSGPAGVTMVIIREDLIGHAPDSTPSVLNYKLMAANNSLYNTPPCYSIYMCGLIFEWIKEQGGVGVMESQARQKCGMIYDVINNSDGFYCCVVDKEYRSRINITFTIGAEENVELQNKFVKEATELNMIQLAGHRSVGGLRASLYNAMPVEGVSKLAEFMKEFQKANK